MALLRSPPRASVMSPLARSVHSAEVVPSHGVGYIQTSLIKSYQEVLQVGSQKIQEDRLSLCFMPLAIKSWGAFSGAGRTQIVVRLEINRRQITNRERSR